MSTISEPYEEGGILPPRMVSGQDAPGRPAVARHNRHATVQTAQRVAKSLGVLSVGLGLAEVLATRSIARLIGVNDHQSTLRLFGLREMGAGLGLFSQRPAGWLWSRVGGDLLDLAFLQRASRSNRSNSKRLAAAAAAVAGVTLVDLWCARQLSNGESDAAESTDAVALTKSIAINRSPEACFHYWRNFANLPSFMKHLESVEVTGDNRSHWRAKAPAGTAVEWDAVIVSEIPNQLISWRSVEKADVANSGRVSFAPTPKGHGTLLRVEMQFEPPAGRLGRTVAKLFGEDPEKQLRDDLRRFKQVMETGEVITTEGQPTGRSSSLSWKYDGAARR